MTTSSLPNSLTFDIFISMDCTKGQASRSVKCPVQGDMFSLCITNKKNWGTRNTYCNSQWALAEHDKFTWCTSLCADKKEQWLSVSHQTKIIKYKALDNISSEPRISSEVKLNSSGEVIEKWLEQENVIECVSIGSTGWLDHTDHSSNARRRGRWRGFIINKNSNFFLKH